MDKQCDMAADWILLLLLKIPSIPERGRAVGADRGVLYEYSVYQYS